MRDSPDDQPTVIEVLSAFIRTHAPTRSGNPGGKPAKSPTGMAVDIQAALTVLGRRAPEHDGHARIDLSHTDLRNADLYRANLTRANLDDTDLRRAYMAYANLTDASLYRADLRDAKLVGANLTNAFLNGADLRSTSLFGAGMADTHLECTRTDGETILPPGTSTYC